MSRTKLQGEVWLAVARTSPNTYSYRRVNASSRGEVSLIMKTAGFTDVTGIWQPHALDRIPAYPWLA